MLDPQAAVRPMFLEFVTDPSERLTDHDWAVSDDRQTWRAIYDHPQSDGRHRAAGDRQRDHAIRSEQTGAFRYLRLSYRASAGQNRLLLRRIRVEARGE